MTYKPHRPNASPLTGRLLRLFTAVAEMPVIGAVLRGMMLRAAGVPGVRAAAAVEPAMGFPTHGLDATPVDDGGQGAEGAAAADPLCGFNSSAAYAAAYRDGVVTPEEIARRFLSAEARSDAAHPPLRAFIATDPADLLTQAQNATARYHEGRPIGPLDGVPVAVKDELDQTPFPTTVGTAFLRGVRARSDATAVSRLRAAGALLVGKCNMHEIGMGVTGLNPHHGSARNPYDPTHATGGSSSGSAAAVAAGLCPIAIGADGGGSIRIPAALCGVVGLKPTFGRVSEHGAAPVCWSVAHVGPIAATARDTALAYSTIAGRDPLDPNTSRQPTPHLAGFDVPHARGVRVGVYRPWFNDADTEVVDACSRVVDELAVRGAFVTDVIIPDLELMLPVHSITIAVEMATAFEEQYRRDRRVFGLDVRLMLLLARDLRGFDFVHAQRLRRRISDHFARVLHDVDVIAVPTTAGTAPLVPRNASTTGEANFQTLDRLTRFCSVSNLTGLPAISFPAGYDAAGLPIGIQFIGRAWREDLLLRLAHIAETFVDRRTPGVHFDLLAS